MNRYINIGSYVTKEKEDKIYYDSILDKFYAVPYNFFDNSEEGLEYLGDLLPEDYEDPNIKPYELTNKDEIKGLKSIVKYNQRIASQNVVDSEEEKINKDEVKKEELEEKKVPPYKKAIIGCIIILASCYLLYATYNHYSDKIQESFDEVVESLENKDETKEKYLSKIIAAIEANATISDEVKTSWINDFTYLFNADIFMKPPQVRQIEKRITTGKFDNIYKDNYLSVLSNVIFNDDYSVYLGLTAQLDVLANERGIEDAFDANLFGYLSLDIDNNLLKETFLFGPEKYNDILARTYGVTPDEIKELTDLLDKYYRGLGNDKDQYYSEYVKKLCDMFIKYYQNKGRLSEYDQFVLVSDIYNDGISSASDVFKTLDITNNLFDDYIVINVRDLKYGHYNLYFDPKTHVNVTASVYQDKLIDLIKNKGGNLDYNDPDCRFLVYLYVLGYKDKFSIEDAKELITASTPEDLAYHLIDSIFDNDNAVKINPEFLYSYFTNGNIDFKEMFDEVYGFSGDTLSSSLFIEYERCLKHEVLDGRISEDTYQEQFEKLKKRASWYKEELVQYIEDAIDNDETMFTDFKLPFSNIEYTNDEIKKYTYETKIY